MLNKNVTKDNLIRTLSEKAGYPLNYSKKIINDLINVIIENTKNGDLNLKNLGSFKVIEKKERIGRNPKTKEEFIIKARKSLRFVPSEKFKIYLNEL